MSIRNRSSGISIKINCSCRPAHAAITDPHNDLLLSAATIWEIAIKVGIGKLTLSSPFNPWMDKPISDLHVAILSITVNYADAQSALPHHHGASVGSGRTPAIVVEALIP